jgi:hypothetical protein
MHPTGLGSGIDKDRPDFTIFSDGWAIGRIYQTRGGPRSSEVALLADLQSADRALEKVVTLEEAKARGNKL